MTGSLIKREYLEKGMHSRRMPSKDEGRDQGNDSTKQRIPNHQKLDKRHGIYSSQPLEETNPTDALISDFQNCEIINF